MNGKLIIDFSIDGFFVERWYNFAGKVIL